MTKKRLLLSGEASWLSTGYASFGREVLKRLYATNKYEIAEFGSYGRSDDPRAQKLPWAFYGALPMNKNEENIYLRDRVNEFGAYKFDAVVADFQPDVVLDFRDPWMFNHVANSRFRDNYKLILTPTVDSAPQRKEWIKEVFSKADVITTYSRYGKRVLEEEGLKVAEVTSPGVDLDIFRPMDKEKVREDWGIGKKLLVIGTVMRNQKRKLFPDLFAAYAMLRNKYKRNQDVERSVLLCHTSWPDVGWDIPDLVYKNGIQRHVIFTYICHSCDKIFFSWLLPTNAQGMGRCMFCGQQSAMMPNTHKGVSEENLAEIYNFMDIYIQPATCEGWGLPIVEAKACGVPGLYTNYSAMEDHVENGGGLPIKVGRFYNESLQETSAVRALPSREDMVEQLYMLLTESKKRRRMGKEARKVCEDIHTWDGVASTYERIIDELEIKNRKTTWNKRPQYKLAFNGKFKEDLTKEQFILGCYRVILGREPDEPGFLNWMKALEKGTPRQNVESFFRNEVDMHNKFEQIRFNKSLILRGYDPNQSISIETNNLLGQLV